MTGATSLPSGATTILIGMYSVSNRMSPQRWLRRNDTARRISLGVSDMAGSVAGDDAVEGGTGLYAVSMSLICVPIYVDSIQDLELALERARTAVSEGARLVEWRFDALAEEDGGVVAMRRLVAESPAPCIVTIRAESEGGTWDGDEMERIAAIEAIGTADATPAYIDLEVRSWGRSANLRQKMKLVLEHEAQVRDISTRLILSSHDFAGRPSDLLGRVATMAGDPDCALVKIVFMARSVRDNLELFDLLAERTKPTIALGMGEYGLISRILAPKFGGFLTFAASGADATTAPGQPTVRTLTETFRFDAIGRDTRVYGIVGHPVAHSLSPCVHNAGFEAIGHDGVYVPLPVAPGWESFKATVGELIDHRRLDFGGCSVTIPHKEHLPRLVREMGGRVDEMVERIGAANTLTVDRGVDGEVLGLRCSNTDVGAVSTAVRNALPKREAAPHEAAVVGAGGVARAAIAGLRSIGCRVHVFNRTPERLDALLDSWADVEGDGLVRGGSLEAMVGRRFDVIVNATSVGMGGGPAPEESPLPDGVVIDESVVVMDTVYDPRRTVLLDRASQAGATTIDGLTMFVLQARAQFIEWTGVEAPVGLFEARVGIGAVNPGR